MRSLAIRLTAIGTFWLGLLLHPTTSVGQEGCRYDTRLSMIRNLARWSGVCYRRTSASKAEGTRVGYPLSRLTGRPEGNRDRASTPDVPVSALR